MPLSIRVNETIVVIPDPSDAEALNLNFNTPADWIAWWNIYLSRIGVSVVFSAIGAPDRIAEPFEVAVQFGAGVTKVEIERRDVEAVSADWNTSWNSTAAQSSRVTASGVEVNPVDRVVSLARPIYNDIVPIPLTLTVLSDFSDTAAVDALIANTPTAPFIANDGVPGPAGYSSWHYSANLPGPGVLIVRSDDPVFNSQCYLDQIYASTTMDSTKSNWGSQGNYQEAGLYWAHGVAGIGTDVPGPHIVEITSNSGMLAKTTFKSLFIPKAQVGNYVRYNSLDLTPATATIPYTLDASVTNLYGDMPKFPLIDLAWDPSTQGGGSVRITGPLGDSNFYGLYLNCYPTLEGLMTGVGGFQVNVQPGGTVDQDFSSFTDGHIYLTINPIGGVFGGSLSFYLVG